MIYFFVLFYLINSFSLSFSNLHLEPVEPYTDMTVRSLKAHRHQSKHERRLSWLLFACIGASISFILYFHLKNGNFFEEAILSELEYMQYVFHDSSKDTAVTATITTSRSNSTSLSSCFPYNTNQWLEAGSNGRLGNNNESSSLGDELIFESILNLQSLLSSNDMSNSRSLYSQTLCHEKSRFVNNIMDYDSPSSSTTTTTRTDDDDKTVMMIRTWSLRLTYLAVHIHQHVHAISEAKVRTRQSKSCQSMMESRGIGKFDFECPTSKFLVVSLGQVGLGGVMRLGVTNALIAGIASNRTVLFMNNLSTGPKFLRQPWPLASCSRMDLQCFYMPISPCVLTQDDIKNAPVLARGDTRKLYKTGKLSADFDEERVVIMNSILRPQRTPPTLRENLVKIINRHIIDPLRKKTPTDDDLLSLLVKAANHTLQEPVMESNTYPYYGRASLINHVLVFYAMRPNTKYSKKLESILHQTIQKDFNPNLALGLPIRASDKCLRESECLSFSQHMNVMAKIWGKHEKILSSSRQESATAMKRNQQDVRTSIIVTSESSQVHRDQQEYLKKGDLIKNFSFPFQFVNNDFDLHQGTGDPLLMVTGSTNATLDDFMLSAISSLKLQLHARYTVGNCCSNFHLLLFDFLEEGCGPAIDQEAECLQDNENPEYRLCCSWSKTEECMNKRNITLL